MLADHVIDLVDNHVDAGIRIGRLPDSALVVSHIGDIHWVTCASPAYLSRRGAPSTPAELEAHDCLAFEGLERARDWRLGQGNTSQTISIRPRFAVNTAESLIDAATAGLGICRVTSYQAATALKSGGLVKVLTDFIPEPLPIHLVHAGQPMIPLKLRAFLDFAKPRLRAQIAAAGAI